MRNKLNLLPLIEALIWIALVPLFFKFIPERKIAATIAGFGFFMIPLFFLFTHMPKSPLLNFEHEVFHKKYLGLNLHKWSILLTLQFWILFAVPIFFSRLIYWSEDFQSFRFFGIFSADEWHHLSSKSYMVMVIGMGLFGYFYNKTNAKRPSLH